MTIIHNGDKYLFTASGKRDIARLKSATRTHHKLFTGKTREKYPRGC